MLQNTKKNYFNNQNQLISFLFLGCCGAACQNQCMLGSFIIILFIFLGANVAGIVYLFAQGQFPNEVEFAANELENTIPYYKQGKTVLNFS